jgi:hypothetical protein
VIAGGREMRDAGQAGYLGRGGDVRGGPEAEDTGVVAVAAPGEHGPGEADSEARVVRRHLDDPVQPGHLHRRAVLGRRPVSELAVGVVAPGQDRAVGTQRERVRGAGRDLVDRGQASDLHREG